jgi:hypothetical protein
MTTDESAGAGVFTDGQMLYYGYLRRRRQAGEVGSRMSMNDVVAAYAKLVDLMGGEIGIDEAIKTEDREPVSDEVQALCDFLYLTVSASEPGGEDAPA